MFEHYTDSARRVIVLAQEESQRLKHNYIGTEHILLGIVRLDFGIAVDALTRLGVGLKDVLAEVARVVGEATVAAAGHVPFTPRAKKILELASREATSLGHSWIGPEHILVGVLREGEGIAAQALAGLGIDLNALRRAVLEELTTAGPPRDQATGQPGVPAAEPQVSQLPRPEVRESPVANAPCCPGCGRTLINNLSSAVLRARVVDGTEREAIVLYCTACKRAIGIHSEGK